MNFFVWGFGFLLLWFCVDWEEFFGGFWIVMFVFVCVFIMCYV